MCVQVFEPAFRAPFPNVTRWFLTCVNQPEFKAELGDFQLCSKAAQFDGTGATGKGKGKGKGEGEGGGDGGGRGYTLCTE